MRKQKPLITYLLIIICTLVYIAECLTCHNVIINNATLFKFGAIISPGIHDLHINWILFNLPRLFTAMFVHLTPDHLLANMTFLAIMGRYLESLYGHWRFLLLYILSGICGNIAVLFLSASKTITAGASTSLFGLIATGILISQLYHAPEWYQFSQVCWGILASNLLIDMFSPTISLTGHLGGLLGGFIFSYLLVPQVVKPKKFNQHFKNHKTIVTNYCFNNHHVKELIGFSIIAFLAIGGCLYLKNNDNVINRFPLLCGIRSAEIDRDNGETDYFFNDDTTYHHQNCLYLISKQLQLPKGVRFLSTNTWSDNYNRYGHAYAIDVDVGNYNHVVMKLSYKKLFTKIAQITNQKLYKIEKQGFIKAPIHYVSIDGLSFHTNNHNEVTDINFTILISLSNPKQFYQNHQSLLNKQVIDANSEGVAKGDILPNVDVYNNDNKDQVAKQVHTTITVGYDQIEKIIYKRNLDNDVLNNDNISLVDNLTDSSSAIVEKIPGSSTYVINKKQITQQLKEVNQQLPSSQQVNDYHPAYVAFDKIAPQFDKYGNITNLQVTLTFYPKKEV